MRRTRDLIYDVLVLISDVAAIIAAYTVAYGIRAKLVDKPLAYPYGFLKYIGAIIYYIPIWILVFAMTGLYKSRGTQSRLGQAGQLLIATASGTMVLILVDFYRQAPLFPSKGISILGFGLSFLFVLMGREILHHGRRWLVAEGRWTKRVVLVGAEDETAKRIIEVLKPEGGRIVAVVSQQHWSVSARRFNTPSEFIKKLSQLHPDEVIQVDPNLSHDSELELIRACHRNGVNYRLVPNMVGLATAHQTLTTIDGVPVIDIKPTPLDGWGRIVKRSFDFVGSLAGLVVLSPLFLLIGLLIKITDPGPIFYKQRRLSREGKPINIFKFRTMQKAYSGVPDRLAFEKLGQPQLYQEFAKEKKLSNDPRLSKIGSWLRRTSLDELPQLANVLVGQLSMVGPRPMLEDELERFGNTNLTSIFSLKCGVTGLWQVSGRSDIGFKGRVRLDLYYVENWSLWLDVKILLKTVKVVLKKQGAY